MFAPPARKTASKTSTILESLTTPGTESCIRASSAFIGCEPPQVKALIDVLKPHIHGRLGCNLCDITL